MLHVILGASAAGVRAAVTIREMDPTSDVVLVSKDTQVRFNCILPQAPLRLTPDYVPQRKTEMDGDPYGFREFFARNRIDWLSGMEVVSMRAANRRLILDNGLEITYGRLLIATGATPLLPAIPHFRRATNLHVIRSMPDILDIINVAVPGCSAAVLGGSIAGADTALALLERGVHVTVIDSEPQTPLDPTASHTRSLYQSILTDKGAKLITCCDVEAGIPDGNGGLKGLKLANKKGKYDLPIDFCVVCAGLQPNISFIDRQHIALSANKCAIAINNKCQTSTPNVYAAGDVTLMYPIWPEPTCQSQVAAINMTGGNTTLSQHTCSLTPHPSLAWQFAARPVTCARANLLHKTP